MPRFAECIWPHEIHPMHMTLRFLVSICFQYLNVKETINTKSNIRAPTKLFVNCLPVKKTDVGSEPHLMIQGKEKNDLNGSLVEQVQQLVIHLQ